MNLRIAILLWCFLPLSLTSQDKKMTLETYDIWKSIYNVKVSNDGEWVSYILAPEDGDGELILYNTISHEEERFERGENQSFDPDGNFMAFFVKPHKDSLDELERKKVKKKKFPKDTLGIFHLKNASYDKFARVTSYKLPKKHGGIIAFKFEEPLDKDSTLVKPLNGDNGTSLFVYNYISDEIKKFDFVKDYQFSDRNRHLMIHHTGPDSVNVSTIDLLNLNSNVLENIYQDSSKIYDITLNENASSMAFLNSQDSIDDSIADMTLSLWNSESDTIKHTRIDDLNFLDSTWKISQYYTPLFSKDGARLYFGVKPKPQLPDSTLLDSEKVKLEIWNYKDGILYPQQKVRKTRDEKRSYSIMYDIGRNQYVQISNLDIPNSVIEKEFKSDYLLSYNTQPYDQYISWLGYAFRDVYLTHLPTGDRIKIANKAQGRVDMSPDEKYAYWYSRPDSSWMVYDIKAQQTSTLTKAGFYDEENDRPMHPYPSGMMSWTDNDEYILVYDHFDIWKINPESGTQTRLTKGRENKLRYRYIKLDNELRSLPLDTIVLVHLFNENDKSSGYAFLNLKNGVTELVEKGPYNYTSNIYKSKNTDKIIFTKSSFENFPDLILTDLNFKNQKTISDANPQQQDYAWGSIELFTWKNYEDIITHGLLVKPPGFDPDKKYPLIVNFYERSSQGLYNHRAPYPHRSTINYSYWANKGYVIFNPDVYYKVGYPGQSCYDAVMSGVDALLELGFIDASKMGLQGHSWGGYQIADLLTRTDRFACAESGAPVVNMISAYGGIRWGSGMSRMFQYEKTQSRLGATLWENPDLYLENSPIFNMDKVKTPVLILHNDEDGAVPWYQGIEYFVALRRLGKPVWLLNYNNEPHWPVKRQNRLDFNKRLEQFFDHYLMDAPLPEWMGEGVPAVESEYNDGLRLLEKE